MTFPLLYCESTSKMYSNTKKTERRLRQGVTETTSEDRTSSSVVDLPDLRPKLVVGRYLTQVCRYYTRFFIEEVVDSKINSGVGTDSRYRVKNWVSWYSVMQNVKIRSFKHH